MSGQDAFGRIVGSLHEAALDDSGWPATSALIDEACGMHGNALLVGEGPPDDVRVDFVGLYFRGERRPDVEREYLEVYHPIDERVPRARRLPDSRIVRVADLYRDEELRTSRTYNEFTVRSCSQDGVVVRLDVRQGCHITWCLGDPAMSGGWGHSELGLLEGLLPHVRQFIRVRQALSAAGALGATVSGLLDNTRVGVLHLDRRGRIVAANDRARILLRRADGLSDRGGVLRAREASEDARLDRLLAGAVPAAGAAVAGSMLIRRLGAALPLVVHVKPVSAPQADDGSRNVAALVLVVEPDRKPRIDPAVVSALLGLTTAESRVAARLAEGWTVRDIAVATGRRESTVRWHVKRIHEKHGLSRQADLVRLVLAVAEHSGP